MTPSLIPDPADEYEARCAAEPRELTAAPAEDHPPVRTDATGRAWCSMPAHFSCSERWTAAERRVLARLLAPVLRGNQ